MTSKKSSLTNIFLIEKNFLWFKFKILYLFEMYNNPRKYFTKIKFDKEIESEIREFIKIEIITTFVHLSEIFGIYMICFHKKNKNFHNKLFDYRVKEVTEFYEQIKKRRTPYIRKMLCYPSYNQIPNKEQTLLLNKSAKNVKEKLGNISRLYLKYKLLYNSYKHGLRVFPVGGLNYSTGTMVIKNKKNQIIAYNIEIQEAIELTEWMIPFLYNTLKTFNDIVIKKKTSFNTYIYK